MSILVRSSNSRIFNCSYWNYGKQFWNITSGIYGKYHCKSYHYLLEGNLVRHPLIIYHGKKELLLTFHFAVAFFLTEIFCPGLDSLPLWLAWILHTRYRKHYASGKKISKHLNIMYVNWFRIISELFFLPLFFFFSSYVFKMNSASFHDLSAFSGKFIQIESENKLF